MEKMTVVAGRVLLGHLFLLAGLSKISAYHGTQDYMEAMGIAGGLLPLVIALEVVAGLAVIIGWQTRWAAVALAGFTLIAGGVFHNNFADQLQLIMFMKNLSITGGLLLLSVYGAGAFSVDHWLARRSGGGGVPAVSH